MSKALFTEDQIIKAGEEITAESGEVATGWQIHQRLGGQGKLDRYDRVWREHCRTRTTSPASVEFEIPETTQTRIEQSVNTLGASVSAIVADVIRNQLDQARRQISLAQLAHDQQLREVVDERDYLRTHVGGLEDALERAGKEISALERKLARAESQKRAQAKASKAGTKSPRQSPRKTAVKQASDLAEDTKPSPS